MRLVITHSAETKNIEPNIINGMMMFIILIVVFMALLLTKIRTTNRIKVVTIAKKDIKAKIFGKGCLNGVY